MSTQPLQPKPPRDDPARREQQRAVKQSLIALPAFGLTLLAAAVQAGPDAAYPNYELPTDPAGLAFTLKGALRLEMMNSRVEPYQRYRRLFGSNTRAKDLKAWRSRAYVQAFPDGLTASAAAQQMLLAGAPADAGAFLKQVAAVKDVVVLMQVDDVYTTPQRDQLFSELLASFLTGESRLLRLIAALRILPTWKEATP